MDLSEKFSEGFNSINKVKWIILIPVLLDVLQLLAYQRLYHTIYLPNEKIFAVKIGIITTPPSVNFLLEDFPSVIFQYNNYGFKGIIYELSLVNIFLTIALLLVFSFIYSGYLSVLNAAGNRPVSLTDFFVLGNRLWAKYFLLQVWFALPLLLMLYKRELVFLAMINIIFFYVKFSIVVDEGNILANFKKGVSFFFANIGMSIMMAFYFGIIFSVISIFVFLFARMGMPGIVTAIIVTAYFGAIVNKAVLEVYRGIINQEDIPKAEVIAATSFNDFPIADEQTDSKYKPTY